MDVLDSPTGSHATIADNGHDDHSHNGKSYVVALLHALQNLREGDASVRLPNEWTGLPGKLADAFNDIASKNEQITRELSLLRRVAGKEGRLACRAPIGQERGFWRESLESVNELIDDLVHPTTETARVIGAVARGDLSQTMALDVDGRPLRGEFLRTAKIINKMVQQLGSFAAEVTRVAREVGTAGKLGGQAKVKGVAGIWKDLTDSVNSMAGNLTAQVRNIAGVTTAVAKGDLSKKVTVDVKGEFLELKNTVNTMVDQLNSFASEVTRVAREVGTEGKLGGQAKVQGVAGTWKDLTESVNSMANNLTVQLRDMSKVATAIAMGDLTQKITVNVSGEILQIKDVINTMVDQLSSFASEVTRVAREVGTEGKLGGQANVKGVAGTWKDLTESVNSMANNLTVQLRDMSKVATAIAMGDLTQKITVNVSGEILQIKDVMNTMVDQLSSFASEVTRVARDVGTEGKLGGQANVKGVAGTWKDLTESVNSMATNLTVQLRDMSKVATAIAMGDLTQKVTVEVRGEILQIKDVINTMVDQLSSFASEVTRVAREVGTEGKLGGQANVKGVAGTWKDLTESVNSMANNLTVQLRDMSKVATAIAMGDLTQKITVNVSGEILQIKDVINTMVDQLSSFASEVTRVAREVGTEGKLAGQANVRGVAGTWKDLTDSVNMMAGNLTAQVRNIAQVTTAVAKGDLSKKITVDVRGEILELKDTINTMVDQLRSFAAEVTRVAREVGTEGRLGGQANVPGVAGTWKDLTDSVNSMAGNLTAQVRNIAEVTTAVAKGDLSKQITVDVKGEIWELKNTINTMVDQLNSFASEVTRVAREVGTEGKLGGQAKVQGVAGTWKDLTESVNSMATNLTNQVRGIAKVVTAVAEGNLRRKLTVDAKGEIASLADTINSMIDTLAIFADQVTTVAREVGIEGKLGGQAKVPGTAGIWKALTENVNQLAANLTTQVRAIADVATAVTKGDLTRSITVETQGEVASLKDTINEMIRNLRDSTTKNTEQDWLKTNLAKFSRMLQGQRDLTTVGRLILSELAPVVNAQFAEVYVPDAEGEGRLTLLANYGADGQTALGRKISFGEGLVGQCAIEKNKIVLEKASKGYVRIRSGLGNAEADTILVMPIIFEGHVKGVMELATLHQFTPMQLAFLDQLTESIGIVFNTIQANMRTEDLLKQSQSLAQELQQTNSELQEKARLLAHQNEEVERKNREVEQARQALEEKAKQLALTSKYKSEFLANMSHELRTPLNSLLILSDQLSRNVEGNLSRKQTEFATTIHSSGNDLLTLINDILDLSKIESGTVAVDVGEVPLHDLCTYVERSFRHVAESKGLAFDITISPGSPQSLYTDSKRLQQVLKNLLSNAFKFTRQGRVSLAISPGKGAPAGGDAANNVSDGLEFTVSDTGIGIPYDKQLIIFEAFQQADGSTSRKYGGTGLGLAISRELTRLLGGELRLVSNPGRGSTFTLYIPLTYVESRGARRLGADAVFIDTTPSAPATLALPAPEELAPSFQVPAVNSTQPAFSWSEAEEAFPNEVGDDRDAISPHDRVALIIENDLGFARLLLDCFRERGFKGLVTSLGAVAPSLTRDYKPDLITLDIFLPDIDGWRVLHRLKNGLSIRHVPVCVISTDDSRERALQCGALAFLGKPILNQPMLATAMDELNESTVVRTERRILAIDPDGNALADMQDLLGGPGIDWVTAKDGKTGMRLADQEFFDCMIVGANVKKFSFEGLASLLESKKRLVQLPVIIHGTDGSGDSQDYKCLSQVAAVRRTRTRERLLDDIAFFLHREVAKLPPDARGILEGLHSSDRILAGKNVLIVDDDMRNIFALASVLEDHDIKITSADNGRDAIRILERQEGVDIVLMDIMMPEMDGIETMREIRKRSHLRDIPIVAVTAKAMKGDREKCVEAGAWDYLAKPVDVEQLLAVLRAWLHR